MLPTTKDVAKSIALDVANVVGASVRVTKADMKQEGQRRRGSEAYLNGVARELKALGCAVDQDGDAIKVSLPSNAEMIDRETARKRSQEAQTSGVREREAYLDFDVCRPDDSGDDSG